MLEESILSKAATDFVAELQRKFGPLREDLLKKREAYQAAIDAGKMPDFLEEIRDVRSASWKVASIPRDLQDRRVEITGPVDRKMIINALNSGAKVFMADFEDSHSPTFQATLDGQVNLYDAIRRTIS